MLDTPRMEQPLRTFDEALSAIASTFGEPTAAWVRLQMEFSGH